MNSFDIIILSSIFIAFPLLLHLVYVAHSRNISKQENDIFLGLALFSSMYLFMKIGIGVFGFSSVLVIDIPIIIAYIKNRKIEAVILSVIAVFYYIDNHYQSLTILIIEYLVYFILYYLKQKKLINISDYIFASIFITLKGIIYLLSMIYNYTFDYRFFLYLISSYIIMFFVVYLLKKGDEILKYHMTFKELEKDKQIKMSLFKITHEIKNPLAVCKGYLDMLDTNNIDKCKKYIPIIREEIARTLILLQDFLSINRINLDLDILDINFLVEESINNLKGLFKERNIKVKFENDDEIYINGDYNRLIQVIINILKNSVEAFENVKKSKIEINSTVDRYFVYLTFKDNGIGIEPKNLEKMGEPFFTTKAKGTGLGVCLSKEIIKAHGGEIKYQSKLGEGTEVQIKIPLMD